MKASQTPVEGVSVCIPLKHWQSNKTDLASL